MTAAEVFRLIARTRRQRAMFFFLCADAAVFGILFFVYVYLRSHAPAWPIALHFASGLMAVAMTLFTFCGSYAMFVAAREWGKGGEMIPVRLMIATVALLGTFLLLDAMEWARLVIFEHVTIATSFGATFFALTGFQALHALVAIVYIIAAASKIKESDVGACALFVHFLNLVWLALFAGLYLSNSDLQGL